MKRKLGSVFPAIAWSAIVCCGAYALHESCCAAEPAVASIAEGGVVKDAEVWLNPETVMEKTGAGLAQAGLENRLLLAQWMLARQLQDAAKDEPQNAKEFEGRVENCRKQLEELRSILPAGAKPSTSLAYRIGCAERALVEAEAELATPHTIRELLATKDGAALLAAVTSDPAWLEQIVFSGENNNPARTLGILSRIAAAYPHYADTAISRDIATATALEFGRYNWNTARAVERYAYFAKHEAAGDLNAVFRTLPFWQRRIVCGAKGENDFCTNESFEWALENVKLPAHQYSGCCWRCGYKVNNPYGESIHGSLFFEPFAEHYGRNRMKFTYEVGGVCGSLSHFGAYSACANGIPALTAGEPGHCAFVLLVGDKWTPSYSLSWERGLHWQVFAHVHVYASLHMASELFSAEQKAATDQSNALRVLAGEYARRGDTPKALQSYAQAVACQPNNYYAWREYARFLSGAAPADAAEWCKLNQLLCKHLAPKYPEMAANILASFVHDGLRHSLAGSPDKLEAELMRLWGSVDAMGPDRWRIEQHINAQMEMLGVNAAKPEQVIPFAARFMKGICNAKPYLPVAFSWINGVSDKFSSGQDKQRLLQAAVASLSGMKGAGDKELVKTFAPLVLAAEKARDRNTFQAIRKMLPKDYGKDSGNIPAFEPFPGKLMSQGGLVWISSTCRHDDPCEHTGVLEPTGGRYHSDGEVNPWIAVELTKQAHLSGIVVVFTQAFMERQHDIHVQISETGKDDDWHDVNVTPRPARVLRVDLSGSNPLAKYVRILRGGDQKGVYHLNGIYVYGTPAA